ncbi:hypothetical protein ARMA_2609 [Ardenticatena maritima]|uniref:Cupin type-2 domain-containing protein n=1 Tax=Ardenticatena maritima TaxID=872965 RepID=A0A0M8KBF6_9CHLR|nr:cupin domain-containing protein [Ardenticatena maritima]KPL89624.1 hypothetical protein SE16_04210 [Ardenticatena maritima]GAP64186.1 hypothetical protein ARMA_2609 [Ardenticatena maritima]
MPFYRLADRATRDLAPGVVFRSFWGDQMTVTVVEFEPHAAVPEHRHPAEQTTIVIEGSLIFTLDGETRTLRPGELVVVPGNVPHAAKAGPEGAKVVDAFSPARPELHGE